MTDKRMVDIDGLTPCRIDAEIVSCMRVESGEGGSYLVIHTSEGFAIGVQPPTNKSLNEFYLWCLKVIWPPEVTTTTTRQRRKSDG